jgi:proteasome alpha subunit
MTEEPYRWLEAISNRREYIREQLKDTTPVFAFSRPEGILLLGVGRGMSKVFEIYDRHAYAALGHPVDIEKIRQSAIEAAHLEGFNRSARDVTLRRLVGFALSPQLKSSFEQIFSPPIMVEAIFAELGDSQAEDILVRVHYDGNHSYDTSGVVVAASDSKAEEEAAVWLRQNVQPNDPLDRVAAVGLTAWQTVTDGKPFGEATPLERVPAQSNGRMIEAALLDRQLKGAVHYRTLTFSPAAKP